MKTMKYIGIILSTLFFSCTNNQKPTRIQVSGEGKIRVMPNLVNLTINVSFTKPRMVESVKTTQETIDTVISILEKYGRKDMDIKTSSISANKEYQWDGSFDKFVGFQAQQTIDFVLTDISKFTELTGKLLETKISSISGIQFSHSKSDSLLREADLLAYDDALKSATKLSDRANVKLGKLLYISNSGGIGGYSAEERAFINSNSEIKTFNKGYGGRGFKISPEVLEFKRSIISEFEITN